MFPVGIGQGGTVIPANLVAWHKASTLVLNDVDPIPTLTDSSLNGNTATAAGASQPFYKTNQLGSNPGVRFNWGQTVDKNILSVANSVSLALGQLSVFWVGTIHGRGQIYPARGNILICKNATLSSGNLAWALYAPDSATSPRTLRMLADIGGLVLADAVGAIVDDTYYVYAGRYDGAELTTWLNGVKVATTPQVGAIPTTTGLMQLGGYNGSFSADEYSNSGMLESRVYNLAKSDGEMLSISLALKAQYGF